MRNSQFVLMPVNRGFDLKLKNYLGTIISNSDPEKANKIEILIKLFYALRQQGIFSFLNQPEEERIGEKEKLTFLREFATCFRSFADYYKGKELGELERIYMEVQEYDPNKNINNPYRDIEPKTHKQISADSFGKMSHKKNDVYSYFDIKPTTHKQMKLS